MSSEPREGCVILAATPIGRSRDATAHLSQVLSDAEVIAAEDTRTLRELLRRLDITPTGSVVSYHDHNESDRAQELVAKAQGGSRVVVVSDAGMPAVSDPGYRVALAAHEAGVRVSAVPGPSAVTTALAVSGLPTDRFCFEGFLPRKPGERARALADLAAERRTMVFFSSPHRLAAELADMSEAFGQGRLAAVCRELTKPYEEVVRAPLAELESWAQRGVRGEVTLVVAGMSDDEQRGASDLAEVAARALALAADGMRLKDAASVVAEGGPHSRREVYEAALRVQA